MKKWTEDNENSQRRLEIRQKMKTKHRATRSERKILTLYSLVSLFLSPMPSDSIPHQANMSYQVWHHKSSTFDVTRPPCQASQELHVCIKRAPSLTSQGLHFISHRGSGPRLTSTFDSTRYPDSGLLVQCFHKVMGLILIIGGTGGC